MLWWCVCLIAWLCIVVVYMFGLLGLCVVVVCVASQIVWWLFDCLVALLFLWCGVR